VREGMAAPCGPVSALPLLVTQLKNTIPEIAH
jgi:hypothetical protein